MAIGVRDITNLEELLEVQDDDKIIVIQNGEAKLASKANAKFGGVTVTVFYGDTITGSSDYIRLLDINRNPIGAQEAYDAIMSGLVYIFIEIDNTEAFLVPIAFSTKKTDAEIVSVVFSSNIFSGTLNFYAGLNPEEGAV